MLDEKGGKGGAKTGSYMSVRVREGWDGRRGRRCEGERTSNEGRDAHRTARESSKRAKDHAHLRSPHTRPSSLSDAPLCLHVSYISLSLSLSFS